MPCSPVPRPAPKAEALEAPDCVYPLTALPNAPAPPRISLFALSTISTSLWLGLRGPPSLPFCSSYQHLWHRLGCRWLNFAPIFTSNFVGRSLQLCCLVGYVFLGQCPRCMARLMDCPTAHHRPSSLLQEEVVYMLGRQTDGRWRSHSVAAPGQMDIRYRISALVKQMPVRDPFHL